MIILSGRDHGDFRICNLRPLEVSMGRAWSIFYMIVWERDISGANKVEKGVIMYYKSSLIYAHRCTWCDRNFSFSSELCVVIFWALSNPGGEPP